MEMDCFHVFCGKILKVLRTKSKINKTGAGWGTSFFNKKTGGMFWWIHILKRNVRNVDWAVFQKRSSIVNYEFSGVIYDCRAFIRLADGKLVASSNRDPRFVSNHRQFLYDFQLKEKEVKKGPATAI